MLFYEVKSFYEEKKATTFAQEIIFTNFAN